MTTTNDDKFQSLTQLVNMGSPSDHNPLGGDDRQLYSPTPRELAYGLYILDQVFPASLQLYQSNPPCISIPGKDAVAFLTTSGIHRLILRILWTVVDPQNLGRLVDLAQLHTILRLAA